MSLRDVGKVKDTTVVTIYHPATGKPLLNADKTEMTVTLHGPYSTLYKTVLREQQQKRMSDAPRAARMTLDADEIESMSNDLLLRCVEAWNITLEGDKKLPDYTRDAGAKIFAEFPWLRDQLQTAMGNVADFLEQPKPH